MSHVSHWASERAAAAPGGVFAPMIGSTQFAVVIVSALFLYQVRKLCNRFIFSAMINWASVGNRGGRAKLLENLWYATYYPLLFSLGCYLMTSSTSVGLGRYEDYWRPFPSWSDLKVDPALHWFYLYQLGFYVQGIVALFLFETRRKDFLELAIHHLVTILLISLSYMSSNHRIGLNVIIVHDFSDIFLYGCKVLHYFAKYGKKSPAIFDTMANLLFVVFAVAFFGSRNVIFPVYIIWQAVVETQFLSFLPVSLPAASGVLSIRSLDSQRSSLNYLLDSARVSLLEFSEEGFCAWGHCVSPSWLLTGLMVVLEALHVFWFSQIVKMIARQVRDNGQVKQDIRSDDEDEDGKEE